MNQERPQPQQESFNFEAMPDTDIPAPAKAPEAAPKSSEEKQEVKYNFAENDECNYCGNAFASNSSCQYCARNSEKLAFLNKK
jgi:hypothetical protein